MMAYLHDVFLLFHDVFLGFRDAFVPFHDVFLAVTWLLAGPHLWPVVLPERRLWRMELREELERSDEVVQ